MSYFLPMPMLTMDSILRFWDKVQKTDTCWLWTGSHPHGYGVVRIRNRGYRASRISYWVHYKIDPAELDMCHECNNPQCINPEHLYLDSTSGNIEYSVNCNRLNRTGIDNSQAKLTEKEVLQIREIGFYESRRSLARKYGVDRRTIQQIIERQTWAHI